MSHGPKGIEGLDERELPVLPKEKRIPVIELFGPVLEGEGKLCGVQTMFVRFGLCDFKCTKCDSMHAVNPSLVKAGATWSTQAEIAEGIQAMMEANRCTHIKNVTFSGGNPAVHDLRQLVRLLHDKGKRVFVETQGTKSPDWLYDVDEIVVSPKSPGMGEKFDPDVFFSFMDKFLGAKVPISVKIVIFSQIDIEFAVGVAGIMQNLASQYPQFNFAKDFFLSLGNPNPPVFQITDKGVEQVEQAGSEINHKKALVEELLLRYNNLSEAILKDPRLSFARFLPQMHVLTFGNETGR